ncbi:MAG: tetratricopeptide repeat protein [Rhodospirillaceae bacterium]|nr:tetratricopeptide repeat protein [Rhodospirillaceae bacterium]MBT5240182.1 tetratricopeptide repeat protein [Rhodospirillaceae bacterium]MBT5566961.1 tetratricopeptide repeat protein [Rhodospirillaceae bacterium]MBT6090352.1 tetratricopeptide repeat protein [Rhodospirillaceae bacterium]MBT6960952.1 tetratricopeptide repeat protein [Rhodospirillaceae bacterium]
MKPKKSSVDHQAEHAKAVESYRNGAHDQALIHVNAAIRAEPNSAIYQADAGVILIALGRNEESLIPLRRATQLDPSHADAHYNMGEAYQAVGQKDKAIDAFKIAMSLNRGLGWKKVRTAFGRWFSFSR